MSDEQNTSIEQLEQNTPDESTPSNLPTEPEKLPDPLIKPTVYPHRSATLLQKNKVGTYLDIIKTKTKLEVVRKSTILK